ncbi:hypothetical protein BDD12DRAFT_853426 [Trichophaea hybrida]|nr:hypothetical protein BDD12DRAFT_853426 [Trichophaea hybrida]
MILFFCTIIIHQDKIKASYSKLQIPPRSISTPSNNNKPPPFNAIKKNNPPSNYLATPQPKSPS